MELGAVEIAAIAVAAVAVVGLLVFAFRGRLFRRRRGRGRLKSDLLSGPRVEVLETKVIDEERKLVLVRCDKVEHLIMIGGPTDLVVENDVKKVRPASQQPAKAAPLSPAQAAANPLRMPPAAAATLDAAIAAVATKGGETPSRAVARPAPEPRALQAQRPGLATVQPTPRQAARNGEAPMPNAPSRGEDNRTAQRTPAPDPGRREVAVSPRRVSPQAPLAPASAARQNEAQRSASASADRSPRSSRTNGLAADEAALPAANVPWAEPDSIENEIVEALRFDPQVRGGDVQAPRREQSAVKGHIDSSTTLGDLADRLEEALAREIQSVAPGRRPEAPAAEANRANNARAAEPERPKRQTVRERQPEKRERTEPTVRSAPAAPEPEPRREPAAADRREPERREETPVISLNARRREAADPLEDEMARLLGELTGDSKGR